MTGFKSKKKKKSKWTGRYWFNSASDWLREWLEFSEPFRERGKAKSQQSQMKSLLTFFFKLKLYKGKHVSSKKKHPLFQAITFLFLIMSFCLFVFRCLNSRLYFQSGSCCFLSYPTTVRLCFRFNYVGLYIVMITKTIKTVSKVSLHNDNDDNNNNDNDNGNLGVDTLRSDFSRLLFLHWFLQERERGAVFIKMVID